MSQLSESLRDTIIARAARAASCVGGVSFLSFREDLLKRSACEMQIIVSGIALARLKQRGEVADDPSVDRLIALGFDLKNEAGDQTEPERSWQAVTVDLPRVAVTLGAQE